MVRKHAVLWFRSHADATRQARKLPAASVSPHAQTRQRGDGAWSGPWFSLSFSTPLKVRVVSERWRGDDPGIIVEVHLPQTEGALLPPIELVGAEAVDF